MNLRPMKPHLKTTTRRIATKIIMLINNIEESVTYGQVRI